MEPLGPGKENLNRRGLPVGCLSPVVWSLLGSLQSYAVLGLRLGFRAFDVGFIGFRGWELRFTVGFGV